MVDDARFSKKDSVKNAIKWFALSQVLIFIPPPFGIRAKISMLITAIKKSILYCFFVNKFILTPKQKKSHILR